MPSFFQQLFVYYETIKREIKRRPIYDCRCDERLKTKAERSTRLTYTGLLGGLEHLKIETRLIDEKFVSANAMGEYVTCLLYTSPSPRDGLLSRMPSSA